MLVRHKVYLAFGTLGLLACGVAGTTAFINSRIKVDVAQIQHVVSERQSDSACMSDTLLKLWLHRDVLVKAQSGIIPPVTSETGVDVAGETAAIQNLLTSFQENLQISRLAADDSSKLAKADGEAEESIAAQNEISNLDQIESEFVRLKQLTEKGLKAGGWTASETAGLQLSDHALATLLDSYHMQVAGIQKRELLEVTEKISHSDQIAVWSSLAILIAGAIGAWALSRSLIRPISQLSDAARRIGEGKLDAKVRFSSRDEFGLLAETFNRMAEDLRATTISRDFQQFAEHINDVFWSTPPDFSKINYVSPAYETIWGRSVESLRANPHQWLDAVVPADQPAVMTALEELARGRNFSMEYRIVQPNGAERWVFDRGFPLRDASGNVCLTLGVCTDITEHKHSEQQLRTSEERFRQLAENIHEVFWITDLDSGKIQYLSPVYEKVWGRTCASLCAAPETWNDATHPQDQQRVKEAFDKSATQGIFDEVYRIIRPDGSIRWVHDRGFPVHDANGKPYRLVGFAEDITEHHQLESQLRQSQKMEAIGTLAGGIAHDFNNILAAINGYTELAKNHAADNPKACAHLQTVLKATSRAVDLVHQILTFSRQQEQMRKPMHLQSVVEESLKLLRATIPTNIEFVTAYAPDAPAVRAVASQVQQVIMNLGTNAWHAMRDRSGRLEVKLVSINVDTHLAKMQPNLHPGHYARLSISDTGQGMDRKTLDRIFEPFFTTKEPGKGTGLGLAVVHGIMQNHEGAIAVYSEHGKGTTFHLYFPACSEDVVEIDAPEKALPHGHGERILYVDDEDLLAQLGRENLTSLGYDVVAETDVQTAIEKVRKNPG